MATERELEEARAQAEEVGAALLLLLGLRKGSRSVRWDERGFFVIGGKKVGVITIRRLLDKIEKVGGARLRKLTRAYFDKTITSEQWKRGMETGVAASHLLFASLALGSLERAALDQLVAERIAEQKRFVRGYHSDIVGWRLSPPRAEARSQSYLLAAAVTYFVLEQRVKTLARKPGRPGLPIPPPVQPPGGGGPIPPPQPPQPPQPPGGGGGPAFTEAKRIRRASESCPGCRIYAGRWMPIGMMPPIGSLDCGSHCRCYLIYR